MGVLRGKVLPGVLSLLLAEAAYCGGLQDREQEVAERSAVKNNPPADTSNNHNERSSAAASSFGSGTYPSQNEGDGFIGGFFAWLVSSPFRYRHDDPAASISPTSDDEEWADEGDGLGRHVVGDQTMPYVRLDYSYQFVENELPTDVHDGRLELGYGILAFHGRMTKYIQSDGFTLDLRQYYGVLRIGGSENFFFENGSYEIGVGAGVVHHTGDVQDDTSGAITVPIKVYPVEWMGVEFRPAWYRWQEITIGDYDLSASLGFRFVNIRAGYRWLWDNGVVDVQSGPYAGLSIAF